MRARTGTAQLPLHSGKAPRWLFSRMVLLAREISTHIVSEFGPEEMLRRLSDPFWFQALVSEIIYGTPASTRDPARFSFAHGGKDGFPFPVDTGTYDHTVEVLRNAVTRAGIDRSERVQALKRLVKFGEERVSARQARTSADAETP